MLASNRLIVSSRTAKKRSLMAMVCLGWILFNAISTIAGVVNNSSSVDWCCVYIVSLPAESYRDSMV